MTNVEIIRAEIVRRKKLVDDPILSGMDLIIGERNAYIRLLSFIDSLQEGPDMEAIIEESKQSQADDILSQVLEEPASEYSFNIESQLFHQLTPEQQKLWREEVEQAYKAGMTVVSADKNIDNAAAKTVEAFRHINLLNGDFLTLAEAQDSVNEYCKMVAIKAFKAGAIWKEQQLLKDAVEAEVIAPLGRKLIEHDAVVCPGKITTPFPALDRFEVGDKIKIIIVKED